MAAVITMTPQQAYELHQSPGSLLIDVRSHMEFLFIGHPVGAVHIPWIDEPDWDINPHFVRDIRQLILGGVSTIEDNNDVPLILICRSGKRSHEAGTLLIKEGLKQVYNVEGGFEGELDEQHHRSTNSGWRFAGLPWEQC